MIIQGLLTLIKNLLSALLILDIPDLPSNVTSYVDSFFNYLTTGAGILANYAPLDYLLSLFFCIIAIDAGLLIYKFIMWILRKIPMVGVS